jgi:phage terminase large subunit GpA-like protein
MNDPQAMRLLNILFSAYKPNERLTVSEWADKYRQLSTMASAEAGQWRTNRIPYAKEIMDKLSSSDPCEEIIFMKAAQVGATELGFNWVGHIIDISPGPMLMVQPTDEMCRRNSKIRFDPMVEATSRLRLKIKPKRSRDSGNTLLQKEFQGGVIVMTGANSAVGLRSMPVRYLFLDEIDGYPKDLDGEGSPINLATARTRTFSRKKIYKCSTPTIKGASAIEKEFETTDQRYYEVPCPHCGGYQRLVFDQLKWITLSKDLYDFSNVEYECIHCSKGIKEHHKTRMLEAGQWVVSKPENVSQKKVGYHLSSLYSPLGWYSWQQAAIDFIEAQKNVNDLKVFINTVLGETWEQKGESPPWENIYDRRENYKRNCPAAEVAMITAGVDVQKDRLEVEIVGWCKNKVSYSIDYRVIDGDTTDVKVWNKLAAIVSEQWIREDGIMMPLRLMAVDTGYNTSYVYDFCRRFDISQVIPIKGQDNQPVIIGTPKWIDLGKTQKKVGKLRLFNIGVSLLKSELYGWIQQRKGEDGTIPPGYCHFPEYPYEYFKGITAEQLEFTISRGYKRYMWVKKYTRNEPLDCRLYARAAATVIGMDRFTDENWKQLQLGEGIRNKPQSQKKKTGSFWG